MTKTLGFALGIFALAAGLVPGLTTTAWAAKFANNFIEFELPPQWQCNLEGAEWVCQSTNEEKRRDAIIVLAAKLKGDHDSLDKYLDYLKSPKSFVSVQGKQVHSEVKYAKSVMLNNQAWIDSLHLESEIPGFYTRYLATVKSDIGVLVTYSINKAKYQQYLNDFDAMIATLKVFRKPGTGINQGGKDPSVSIPAGGSDVFVPNVPTGGSDERPSSSGGGGGLPLPLLLGVGVVAFLIWKRRKKDAD